MKRIFLILILTVIQSQVWATGFDVAKTVECSPTALKSSRMLPFQACIEGRTYQIKLVQGGSQIVVVSRKKATILSKIPKGFDPTLVDADDLIGFLPDEFQPYKGKNTLVYLSSIRTTGGDGRGQCGSGVEIYLNFLDVAAGNPKLKSSILIGSCAKSIELLHQDLSHSKLGEIAVVEQKLSLKFLSYLDLEGYPVATISADFKKLEFHSAE
jgi:hypothetical protein